MTPKLIIKCTPPAFPHASDLMADLVRGSVFIGATSGSEYSETVCGHRFIAKRKECGGIDLREVMPTTREGWAGREGMT